MLVWIAFFFAYNITRGLADHNASAAFENGEWIARDGGALRGRFSSRGSSARSTRRS